MKAEYSDADGVRAQEPVRLTPLKEDLPGERRALAEALRELFLSLYVSVRRYALRRHVDASAVSRYLNGERVPPWDFVVALMGDVGEDRGPLTAETEEILRALHASARSSSRSGNGVQVLQDKLEAADEETRRIKTRQHAIEEALYSRETQLKDAWSRSRQLERHLDDQHLAHQAELEQWQAEYERLETDCNDLGEQVVYLKESLAVTRAELFAAEAECHRLEAQLEALAAAPGQSGLGASALLDALEAADRTASVPELVSVVGDLEMRTQRAMASELVASVSRTRDVVQVAALLGALSSAGLRDHASTTLPTLVMARPVEDIGGLAVELQRLGMEECVVTILQSAVNLNSAKDLAALAQILDFHGQCDQVASLIGAAAVVRPVADLVALVAWLPDEMNPLEKLTPAGLRRPVPELIDLLLALRNAGQEQVAWHLVRAAGAQRPPLDVVELVDILTKHFLHTEAQMVLEQVHNRDITILLAVFYGLSRTSHRPTAAELLRHAVDSADVEDVAVVIHELHAAENHAEAMSALLKGLSSPAYSTGDLIGCLNGTMREEEFLEVASLTGGPEHVAQVITELERGELAELSAAVFDSAVQKRPTDFSARLLRVLCGPGSPYAWPDWLPRLTRSSPERQLAPVIAALHTAMLGDQLELVLTTYVTSRRPTDTVFLYKQLAVRDDPGTLRFDVISDFIEKVVVRRTDLAYQVALTQFLEATPSLATRARRLSAHAAAADPAFKKLLKTAHARHAPRVFSREFWTSRPDDNDSGYGSDSDGARPGRPDGSRPSDRRV